MLSQQEFPYIVIAFWSFSELSFGKREGYLELIGRSKLAIVASNTNFEGIDNFDYIHDLAVRLNKKVESKGMGEIFGNSIPSYLSKHNVFALY